MDTYCTGAFVLLKYYILVALTIYVSSMNNFYYLLLNAIVAQTKYCHLELIIRLSSKIRKLHPTIPAHLLVDTYPCRCHYCKM
jgi:hypothetical protein